MNISVVILFFIFYRFQNDTYYKSLSLFSRSAKLRSFWELKINLDKSILIPVGRVENIGKLTRKFGCQVRALPSIYLDLLLNAPY